MALCFGWRYAVRCEKLLCGIFLECSVSEQLWPLWTISSGLTLYAHCTFPPSVQRILSAVSNPSCSWSYRERDGSMSDTVVVSWKIAVVVEIQTVAHDSIQVIGLDLETQTVSVCEKKRAVVLVFGLQVLIVECVHDMFRQLQNGKANRYRFVQFHLGSRHSDHH